MLAAGGSSLAAETLPVEVEANFNSSFAPQRLARSKQTPLSPRVSMKFQSEFSRVPALREFEIEEDRHLRLHLKGVPVCQSGNVDEPPMRQRCKGTLIGRGEMEAIVYVPEGVPILFHSEVTAYNGGFRDGVRTLLLDAFITVPTPAEIVMTVDVRHGDRGRYGLRLVGSVPKIAGGMASVTHLSFRFHKNVFSATCPVGHLNTGFATTFVDGTHLGGSVTRPCTPAP